MAKTYAAHREVLKRERFDQWVARRFPGEDFREVMVSEMVHHPETGTLRDRVGVRNRRLEWRWLGWLDQNEARVNPGDGWTWIETLGAQL